MPANFLNRVRKDLTINLHGLREVVLTISERVNRKVQVMKLHWQAAQLSDQVDAVYQELGAELAALLGTGERRPTHALPSDGAALALSKAAGRLRGVRGELQRVDSLIRELEAETLRDDLLKLQQDLGTRGLTFERLTVTTGTMVGKSLQELGIPPTCRVIGILRGPTVLEQPDTLPLRGGDIVLLFGRPADIQAARTLLDPPLR